MEILFAQAPDCIAEYDPRDLADLAVRSLSIAASRKPGTVVVRVEGCQIFIAQEDSSFLVRSVRSWLTHRGISWHLLLHPVWSARRNRKGILEHLDAAPATDSHNTAQESSHRESFILVETESPLPARATESALRALFENARAAVTDFPAVHALVMDLAAKIASTRASRDETDSRSFLEWLGDGNFVFLGYRRYAVAGAGRSSGRSSAFRADPDADLGLLRGAAHSPRPRASHRRAAHQRSATQSASENFLTASFADVEHMPAAEYPPLRLGKSTMTADIYHQGRLDFVSVNERDPRGKLVAQHHFYGLYADRANFGAKIDLPILKRKYEEIRRAFHAARGSFNDSEIVHLFSSLPIDALLLTRVEDLVEEFSLTLRGSDTHAVQVAAHDDIVRGGLAVTVIIPADRYRPELKDQLVADLKTFVSASSVEAHAATNLTEGEPVRLNLFFATQGAAPGATQRKKIDIPALKTRIIAQTRSWQDILTNLLEERHPDRGEELTRQFIPAFDNTYRVLVPPLQAADDIDQLASLGESPCVTWGRPEESSSSHSGLSYLKLFNPGGRFTLSDVTPILVHHGFIIEDEISFALNQARPEQASLGQGARSVTLQVFHVRTHSGHASGTGLPATFRNDATGQKIAASILAALTGRAEHDALCGLMATVGLSAREVDLFRMLRNYARQINAIATRAGANNTLLAHPQAVRLLNEMFHAKFAPEAFRMWQSQKWKASFDRYLAGVRSIDDDRALRVFFNIIDAAVRTNYFAENPGENAPLAVKIDCARITHMPSPRPWREIYVYGGAVMEGCHLRGGPVARGGIRWSERPDDFRIEVLGLVKTQVTKNAQIVPTGAKGGFVVKSLPEERGARGEAVRGAYRMLISAILSMQDNIERGKIRHPRGVVAHDGDDPYLVVAADKGTATFSDTANSLSAQFGFWLDDAFASGGSNGFDHKIEGITARGAWISVSRHFHTLGRDITREPFTAIGIGDMSGDVFGNGMLLARTMRLMAAFDHRDILIDPTPDPARSYRERQRLFKLPRSSWQDYNRSLISKGGGIWSRSQKSIPLSPEMRAFLGIESGGAPLHTLDPESLIRAILSAPVDLLYNGGIGTYVRASHEVNAEVGDAQNDAVRVTAADLKCRIIGEGGNLGFTQAARIEFALRGGLNFTDAVDNSAGVDLSDHEVNLKILMDGAKRPPRAAERTRLLQSFKEPIIADVLSDNYHQTLAIELDAMRTHRNLPAFARCLADLERRGVMSAALEGLPDADVLRDRMREGLGLTRPELSVLLSWAKIDVKRRLMDSQIITQPRMDSWTASYFAASIRKRFARDIPNHRLRNEILVTVLTNSIINFHGATVIHRLTTDCGLAASRVTEALLVAHAATRADDLAASIFSLDGRVTASTQYDEFLKLEISVLLAARWLIRTVKDIRGQFEELMTSYHDLAGVSPTDLHAMLSVSERSAFTAARDRRMAAGLPPALAERLTVLEHVPTLLDIVHLARRRRLPVRRVGALMYAVGDRLRLGAVMQTLKERRPETEWDSAAAGELAADLRHSRRVLTARILDLGGDIEAYFRDRARTCDTIQGVMNRVEADASRSLTPYVVIAGQIRNLSQL